jgi:alkylhydroperoxidase/carboxymuconolactone decarboxylase family protein YurZ
MLLDPKTSALIALAYDVARDAETFRVDMVAAISVGATEQELLDVLEVARELGVEPNTLEKHRATIRHHFRQMD